ncbi:MAG: hypothetical protein R3298_09695 [Gammaproteobacteria bacterium]|nr:hypothetical protein [Gammaproteobacteria bacterium]
MRFPLRQHGFRPSHDTASVLLVIQVLATLGCQSMPHEPLEIPHEFAQRPEESGSLPVGIVIGVDAFRIREVGPIETPTFRQAMAEGAASMLIPPVALLAAPAVLLYCLVDGCDEPPPADAAATEDDRVLRYEDEGPRFQRGTAAQADPDGAPVPPAEVGQIQAPAYVEASTVPLDEGEVFRHRVQLVGSETRVIRFEFWRYRIGDCVAIRDNPYMLVPALPGACD